MSSHSAGGPPGAPLAVLAGGQLAGLSRGLCKALAALVITAATVALAAPACCAAQADAGRQPDARAAVATAIGTIDDIEPAAPEPTAQARRLQQQQMAADALATERKLLIMLRLPPPHYRPDAGYGGRYIDDGGRGARRRDAEQLARQHGLALVADWPMPVLGIDCYVMEYPPDASPQQILVQLQQDARVESAQPVALFHGLDGGPEQGDPLYPVQPGARYWHVADLHRQSTGRDVSVAVIDSGVDRQHPDLAGQLSQAENFVDASAYVAEAHGTAVAGIIAARAGNGGILGIAPGARVMALRACWQLPDLATRCSSFTLAKALNYAILHSARVINLSLAGPPDRLLDRLLDVALERGIVVVGAIDPLAPGASFPAAHAGVLAVASQPASRGAGMAATVGTGSGSGTGTGVGTAAAAAWPAGAVLAPGNDIPTTAPGARWRFVNGSSYATAHVSGMVALLAQLEPTLTPAQMRRRLLPFSGAAAATIEPCAIFVRATGACSCLCPSASTASIGSGPHP